MALFFRVVEAVAGIIAMEYYDINEGDFGGCGPLAWVAWNVHKGVVKILLRWGEISPDKPDNEAEYCSRMPPSMGMRE